MKHIQKTGAPHEYVAWYRRVKGTPTGDFRSLQNPEKGSLHKALLQEQGWLCAYTMQRVDQNNSHIEHIKPEAICRTERVGSDLDYDNLVACFPRAGMKATYRYGAQMKGDWWENDGDEFVSPLQPNCETHFSFDLDGNIKATNNHSDAINTIQVLGLDHPTLTEDRMRAIHEFIYGPRGDNPLSKAKAEHAIASVCDRNGPGKFYEFCIAIHVVLGEYVKQLGRIATRRRFGRA